MKRVYVAGPYSADNVLEVLQNIGRGEAVALEVFKAGFAPFTPWHDKTFCISAYDVDFSVEQFYNYSIAWLEVSDAVLLVEGWETSKGTLAEIEIAKNNDIPVFFNLNDLVSFFKQSA